MQIKNIMFDLGGVIMTIDQSSAVRRFTEIGIRDAATRLDPYTQTGIFGELEEGLITADDFISKLSEIAGRQLTFDECKYAWRGYTKEVPMRNIKALDDLRRQGYRLILLSNTNPFMMHWATSSEFSGDGRSILDFFDSTYMSYKMRMMKPDERIFRQIIEREQLLPQETLFVDDGEKNLAVARTFGFNTFRPVNGEDWTEDLARWLHEMK